MANTSTGMIKVIKFAVVIKAGVDTKKSIDALMQQIEHSCGNQSQGNFFSELFETETCMHLKIKITRDWDFSIIRTYFFLYGELKFLLRQICRGLLAVRDDEHAIELKEYYQKNERVTIACT